MSIENLSDIFALYAQGIPFGIGLGFLAFILGFGVQSIYSVILKHSS